MRKQSELDKCVFDFNIYLSFLKIDSYTHCKIKHAIIFNATVLDSLSYTLKDFKNAKIEIHKIDNFLIYQFY